ncbi:hypothetical protein TOPH_08261 [Tolypocladium ophioglossoides CBS 100239]|uniref:Uncharacterized protein n=1 Tax=Tolypocladium ophioglossoides (strain CBS 100239) TaxID=1163406 RepID=A0A0L0MYZ8_TOLOC|nr:hypothetical protein TOPH_08261 [Tolypocladium ophioglossoides CBS 100239]
MRNEGRHVPSLSFPSSSPLLLTDTTGDFSWQVPGMRYHVKDHPIHGWVYEQVPLANVQSANNPLARIVTAKVEDEERLVEIFRETPIVASALLRISKDCQAVGTAQLDWVKIKGLARDFVAEKTASGRYTKAADMALPKPTWDMLEGRDRAIKER